MYKRQGYQFAHDYDNKLTTMECLPPSLIGKTYYYPGKYGSEIKLKQRLEKLKGWKRVHREIEQEESKKTHIVE